MYLVCSFEEMKNTRKKKKKFCPKCHLREARDIAFKKEITSFTHFILSIRKRRMTERKNKNITQTRGPGKVEKKRREKFIIMRIRKEIKLEPCPVSTLQDKP